MSKIDDELNEFIDEVTDEVYNLRCVEVTFTVYVKTINEDSHHHHTTLLTSSLSLGISSLFCRETQCM
jgi:hypothetical protein